MDFVITGISKKLSIFTAQQGLLWLLPFKQQKLIPLPKEWDRFAGKETPAKPVPTSWLAEAMGRAELLPELVVPGELRRVPELNMPCLQAEVMLGDAAAFL